MAGKLTPIGERRERFRRLWRELVIGNTHFHFAQKLYLSGVRTDAHAFAFRDFWHSTRKAHSEACLSQLCRVFDKDERGINLHTLLKYYVPVECLDTDLNASLLADRAVVGPKPSDMTVNRLRKWRNTVIAHLNDDLAIPSVDADFRAKNPWDIKDWDYLLKLGFSILERYALACDVFVPNERLVQGADGWELLARAIEQPEALGFQKPQR
jgi:AbiU2